MKKKLLDFQNNNLISIDSSNGGTQKPLQSKVTFLITTQTQELFTKLLYSNYTCANNENSNLFRVTN